MNIDIPNEETVKQWIREEVSEQCLIIARQIKIELNKIGFPSTVGEVPGNAPISNLPLQSSTISKLKCLNITTIDDLARTTEAKIDSIRGSGVKTVAEVRLALASIGRQLGEGIESRAVKTDDSIKTAEPEPVKASTVRTIRPEWIRLPPTGQSDPYTGLKRSKLNELILPSPANNFKPPVKSVCLRNKGQKKGVRLISYDSLLSYLECQP